MSVDDEELTEEELDAFDLAAWMAELDADIGAYIIDVLEGEGSL